MAVAQDQTDQADELVGEIVVTGSRGFVRIERSLPVNLRRVAFAERALPGGFVFTMAGGRRLCSSRKYRRTIVKAMRFGGSNSSSDGA